INRKPPTWKVSMEGGGTHPVWKLTLADETGIDFGTMQVLLKGTQGGFNRPLVKDGKTAITMLPIELKPNSAITKDEFKLSAGTDIPPGSYIMRIDVMDNAGNVLRADSTAFEVK